MSANDKVVVPEGYHLLTTDGGTWYVVRDRNNEVVFGLDVSDITPEPPFQLWWVTRYGGDTTADRLFIGADAVSAYLKMALSIDKVVDAAQAKRQNQSERELS